MDLSEVDPIKAARKYLLTLDTVTDIFGDRVGVRDEPPYPTLRLSDPPGDDRALTHLVAPLLKIEVLGDPAGTPPRAVLRAALYVVLRELAAWPLRQALGEAPTEQSDPVITRVTSTAGGGWSPEPIATGQRPRYMSTVRLHAHPRPSP